MIKIKTQHIFTSLQLERIRSFKFQILRGTNKTQPLFLVFETREVKPLTFGEIRVLVKFQAIGIYSFEFTEALANIVHVDMFP